MEPTPQQRLDQVRDARRLKPSSTRTENASVDGIRRFILFHGKRPPHAMGAPDVEAFLPHLAVEANVAASARHHARSALLVLSREALNKDLEPIDALHAKKPKRLPAVLANEDVRRVLDHLSGAHRRMAQLLSGAGLRLMERLRRRVKDLDVAQRAIIVRDGTGMDDRVTMLPDSLIAIRAR